MQKGASFPAVPASPVAHDEPQTAERSKFCAGKAYQRCSTGRRKHQKTASMDWRNRSASISKIHIHPVGRGQVGRRLLIHLALSFLFLLSFLAVDHEGWRSSSACSLLPWALSLSLSLSSFSVTTHYYSIVLFFSSLPGGVAATAVVCAHHHLSPHALLVLLLWTLHSLTHSLYCCYSLFCSDLCCCAVEYGITKVVQLVLVCSL